MKRVLILALVVLAGCGERVDHQPQQPAQKKEATREPLEFIDNRRVLIFVDPDTGCHYLIGNWTGGTLVPRLTADGKPLCVL